MDYITYEGLRRIYKFTRVSANLTDYITYEGLRPSVLSTATALDLSSEDYITYEGLRRS